MEQTNNNTISGESIFDPRFSLRPDLGKSRRDCKVDYTDPYLSSNYHLTLEELDFIGKFVTYGFGEMLRRWDPELKYRSRMLWRCLYRGGFFEAFNGVRFCQSSFESYKDLADEDQIDEERRLYESDDILEHGFYAREIRRWTVERERFTSGEGKRLPECAVKATRVPVNIEWLGCYFPYCANNGNQLPEVHLFMDNITEAARSMRCPRKYVVVAVFLHEMCHAYFDRFPLLRTKPYIPEIEEPMAECMALEILYLFVELSRFFYPHGELLDVFDTAYSMVYAKRRLKKICYYSLGVELFHVDGDLCHQYNCFSYAIDRHSQDVKDYVAEFANGYPEMPYGSILKLEKLLDYAR